ncbi:MAG: DUF4126 domain-containing protein [Phycisphaerae bacterium]
METLVGACIGIGLAAACGMRVFIPLLVLGLASRAGLVTLSASTQWLASTPALWTLGVACLVEVIAYWLPSIDHALDVIAAPAALAAGTLAAASQFGEFTPALSWGLGAIAGGGVAGLSAATNISTRGVGTLTTAGLVNPLISAIQSAVSVALSVLAVVVPVAMVVVLVIVLATVLVLLRRRWRRSDGAGIMAAG